MKSYALGRPLDPIIASQNTRHFLNRLNRSLLGRQKSKWCRIRTLAVFEVGAEPHCHFCIDCPFEVSTDDFRLAVHLNWLKTQWSRVQIDVQPCFNVEGWITYMTKQRTKASYADAIDWTNCWAG